MQFTFPAPHTESFTNAAVFSDPIGPQGNLSNPLFQHSSLKTGISQSVGTGTVGPTLFPKPIDVVALLSGADQFSNPKESSKQKQIGLPGPMQLFSTLSISEDGHRNKDVSTKTFITIIIHDNENHRF